ncbi:MAG: VWA domain-containing protein, partial [Phycisphaerales bacterium]|nr:VWA domain-containing protein [Phycisphaerales bacterium]
MLAAIAAAVMIPSLVILYFLKLRRRDAEISSTLLWRKAIEDLQANAPFQTLRNNILLILQLIALILGLLALAQPQWRAGAPAAGRHVIVIDRSGSMQATDGDPDDPEARLTRLEKAKAEAIALVENLREPGLTDASGDEAMVVAFDTIADRICNFTSSKAELKRAIESIRPTNSPTKFVPAFETARAFAKPQEVEGRGLVGDGARVHLFSDGRLPDITEITPSSNDRLTYYPIGRSTSVNLGIVGLRAERAFDDPSQVSVFVSVQNSDTAARKVDVQLAVDGQIAAVREATIPGARVEDVQQGSQQGSGAGAASAPASAAGPMVKQTLPGVSGVVFTLERAGGAVLTVRVRAQGGGDASKADVLAVDDVGYLVLPPARRLAVALVTPGNLFIRSALEALPLAKLDVYTPGAAGQLFDEVGRPLQAYDVYVLDSWLPTVRLADGTSAAKLPTGKVLGLNVTPAPPLGLVSTGAGEPTIVLKHERDHPALRNIAMDALLVSASRKISREVGGGNAGASAGAIKVLAEGVSGPLIYEVTDASTRGIVTTFDVLSSNWPLDAGFVLFMAQSTQYLGQEASDTGSLQIRPGQTLEQQL